MSIEAVINNEPKVFDLAEEVELKDKFIWDKFTEAESENFDSRNIFSYVLKPDIYLTEKFQNYKTVLEQSAIINYSEVLQDINNQTFLKLLYGDMHKSIYKLKSDDVKELKTKAQNRLYEYFNELNSSRRNSLVLGFIPEFLLNLHINFPEVDIGPVLDLFINKFPIENDISNVIRNLNSDRYEFDLKINSLKNRLKDLAIYKILKPELFSNLDLDPLLSASNDYLNEEDRLVNTSILNEILGSLKILYSKGTKIGNQGFEIEMPFEDIDAKVSPLPDRRKF